MYRVFVRNWWRIENGERVPDPRARRIFLRTGIETEEEARSLARAYNARHEPGPLSRRAEIERLK